MSSKVKQNILKFGILIVVAAFFIWLDQWTKALAVAHLMNQEDIILIPGVLQLRYLENRGIAFGMFQGWQWIFSIFTVFVLLLILSDRFQSFRLFPYSLQRLSLIPFLYRR